MEKLNSLSQEIPVKLNYEVALTIGKYQVTPWMNDPESRCSNPESLILDPYREMWDSDAYNAYIVVQASPINLNDIWVWFGGDYHIRDFFCNSFFAIKHPKFLNQEQAKLAVDAWLTRLSKLMAFS